MLRMPVATLRVWERRYALTQPALSPSGQRLYSAADVQRLAQIKQLTDLGHAVGRLAALNMAQLRRVASTHAHSLLTTQQLEPPHAEPLAPAAAPAWRLAVVGAAWGTRLQRPTLLPALVRTLPRPLVLLGPYDDLAQAAAALKGTPPDTLLLHQAHLHEDWLADVNTVAPAFVEVPKAVLYGFAADPVCEAVAAAGTALLREPQPDAVLAQWLQSLCAAAPSEPMTAPPGAQPRPEGLAAAPVAARRWSDAALADFAGLSTTVACECPRHVAELLVQLSHFEAYSADCAHRHAEDAALHAYLQQVAATARTRFEAALEQVALHEGLLLPAAAHTARATRYR